MVAELANASEVVPGAGIESSGEDHDLPDWTLALNRRLAAPAFLVTIVFLAAVHDLVMVVVGGDAIRLNRPAVWICLAVYVGFLLEFGIYWMANASRARGYFWSAVFPPVRATRTDLATGRLIWFPGAGWSPADSRLAAQASGAITSGFIVAVLALLVVVVTLVANGTSFQTLPNYSAFQWIM
ncbi:MAG: hypothetical protein SH850_06220, partial [Planctomycetaceae bacterium]|nr:hypothetical protein [Planctomycetaceae bacterium]